MTGTLSLIACAACLALTPEPADARAGDPYAEQPAQPGSGPGGRDHKHRAFRVSEGGTGADAWYAFEPTKPRPAKAPVAIVMHGYYEYAGYDQMLAMIRHTVRDGTIVIYPRWQTDIATPCPGPFDIEPCIDSSVSGIKGALAFLQSDPQRVQPELRKASYFGFSFGGIITANLTNRYKDLGLPKPRALFLEDPHDGGFVPGETALDDSLAGIPRSTLVQCHSSEDGVTGEAGKEDSSCNTLFPMLGHIPARNKDLVMALTDDHGQPDLTSEHGVCAGGPGWLQVNAYDWKFCWKVWDAIRSCALRGKNCNYALGNTRAHRSNGRWSDGTRVTPLKVRDKAPIRP